MTAALLVAALVGCTPLPPTATADFKQTRQVEIDFDGAWQRIIDQLANEPIPIKALERSSGVIYAQGLVPSDSGMADCGRGRGWKAIDQTAVNLNVFVRQAPTATAITINARFTQVYVSGPDSRVILCVSKGTLEERIFDSLRRAG